MALQTDSALPIKEDPSVPDFVKEILNWPLEKLPPDRPEKGETKCVLEDKIRSNIRTWRVFKVDKSKLENQLRTWAVKLRWSELNSHQAQQQGIPSATANDACALAPQGPASQLVSRLVRQPQGNSQGTRQLRQHLGTPKPQLPFHNVNTRATVQVTTRQDQHVATAHEQGRHQARQCINCSKEVGGAANDTGIPMCSTCRKRQENALGGPSTSQGAPNKFQVPNLKPGKAAAGREAAGPSAGGGKLRPVSQPSFYGNGAGRGLDAGGYDPKQSAVTQKTAAQQSPASQVGKSKRGPQQQQQQQQQQQRTPTRKRQASDGGDEEPPGKRGAAGAVKARGQCSAAVEPEEDKEPIDLVDSSDDEGEKTDGVSTDAIRHHESVAGVGAGPSSEAAGQAANGKNGSFQKLSDLLAGLKCLFPRGGGKHSVEVTAEDLARLESGEFLNDTCIDFYLKYIEANLPDDTRQRYHFFNSFFLKKLQEKQSCKGTRILKADRVKQDHERVKKWTKLVDLFSKDYIFVPIHGYLHWSLVLICHPGNIVSQNEHLHPPIGAEAFGARGAGAGTPLLLHLDSLAGNHAPKAIFEALRSYLELEWKCKMDDETQDSVPRRWKQSFVAAGMHVPDVRFTPQTLPGISMSSRLPKQNNHTDCGLFLLSYVEFLTAANPRCVVIEGSNAQDVHALDPQPKAANVATLLQKNWFYKCNTTRLRDHLRALICRLMLELVPEDDHRCKTLMCVVSDYDNKPHKMGQRYLHPVEYQTYLKEQPYEAEPVLFDDVLSNGSGAEEHVEDPKDVLQSSSRHLTRSVARKAGVQPSEALQALSPLSSKRRKAQRPSTGDAGPSTGDAEPSSRPHSNDKSVVDLSSPGNGAKASPSAVNPTYEGVKAPSKVRLMLEHCNSEGLDVEMLNSGQLADGLGDDNSFDLGTQGGSPGSSDSGVEEPPATEIMPMVDTTMTDLALQGAEAEVEEDFGVCSSDEHRQAAPVGSGAAGLTTRPGSVTGEDDDSEPPNRRRRKATIRGLKRSKSLNNIEIANPMTGHTEADGEGQAAKALGPSQEMQSTKEDPKTLPAARPMPGDWPAALPSAGKLRPKATKSARASGTEEGSRVSAVAANGLVAGTRQKGPHHGSGVVKGMARGPLSVFGPQPHDTRPAGLVVAPIEDGLIPGDNVDSDAHRTPERDLDPQWIYEHAVKRCGDLHVSSSSPDERRRRRPRGLIAAGEPKTSLEGQPPPLQGPGSRATPAMLAALGNAPSFLCRKHTRFSDDDAEPTTELVPIAADEAVGAPPHHAGAARQTQFGHKADSMDRPGGDGSLDQCRNGSGGAAAVAYPDALAEQVYATVDKSWGRQCTPAAAAAALVDRDNASIVMGDAVDEYRTPMAVPGSAVDACAHSGGLPGPGPASLLSKPAGATLQEVPQWWHYPLVLLGAVNSERHHLSDMEPSISKVAPPLQDPGTQPLPGAATVSTRAPCTAVKRAGLSRLVMMQRMCTAAATVTPGGGFAPAARAGLAAATTGSAVEMHRAPRTNDDMGVDGVDMCLADSPRVNLTNPDLQSTSPEAMQVEEDYSIEAVRPGVLGGPLGGMQAAPFQGWSEGLGHGRNDTPQQLAYDPKGYQSAQSTIAAHRMPVQLMLELRQSGQGAMPQSSDDKVLAVAGSEHELSAQQGSAKESNKIRAKKKQLQQQLWEVAGWQRWDALELRSATPVGAVAVKGHALHKQATERESGSLVPSLQRPTNDGQASSGLPGAQLVTDAEVGDYPRARCKWRRSRNDNRPQPSEEHSPELQQHESLQLLPLPEAAGQQALGLVKIATREASVLAPLAQTVNASPNGTRAQGEHLVLRLELHDGAATQNPVPGEVSYCSSLSTDDEMEPRSTIGDVAGGVYVEHPPHPGAVAAAAHDAVPLDSRQVAWPGPYSPGRAGFSRPAREQGSETLHAIICAAAAGHIWSALMKGEGTEAVPGKNITGGMASAAGDLLGPKAKEQESGSAGPRGRCAEQNGANMGDGAKVGPFPQMTPPSGARTEAWSCGGAQAAGAVQPSSRLCLADGETTSRSAGNRDGQPEARVGPGPSRVATTEAKTVEVATPVAAVRDGDVTSPNGEEDRAGPSTVARGLEAAGPPVTSSDEVFGSAGTGSGKDVSVISLHDDSGQEQAEVTHNHKQERGGCGAKGSTAAAPQRGRGGGGPAQRGWHTLAGRGVEGEPEEVDDSSDEVDSMDIVKVRGCKRGDDSDEDDSEEAFVKDKGPGSSRRCSLAGRTNTAQRNQNGKQQSRQQAGGRGAGRGKVKTRGRQSKRKLSPPTKGAGGSTSGRGGRHGKRGRPKSHGQLGGTVDAYCLRQDRGTVASEIRPDFPRTGRTPKATPTNPELPSDDKYDLTIEDDEQ